MSQAELEQLVARAQHLLTSKGKSKSSQPCPLLIEAINKCLKTIGGSPLTASGVMASSFKKQFFAGEAVLSTFVDSYFRPKTRAQKFFAYTVCIDSIADAIRKIPGIPVSPKTLIERLETVAGFVDSSFPGYAQSGLLPVVLKASGSE